MRPTPATMLSALLLTACSSVLGLDEFQAGEGGGTTSSAGGPSTGTDATSTTSTASASTTTSSTTTVGGGGGEGGAATTSTSTGGEGGGGSPPAPTCDDGELNGNEGGVDCGGDCPPCEVACPTETHECAPTIPDWEGPIALVDLDVGCSGPFPVEAIVLRANLDVPEASCACSCGAPTVGCGSLSSGVFYEPACQNLYGGGGVSAGDCIGALSADSSADIRLLSATTTCGPGAVSATIPPPTFATRLAACGGFGEAGTCDGSSVCVPSPEQPFEAGAVCVYRPGEVACPPSYPTGVTYYDGFTDERACPDACDCTVGTQAVCQSIVTRHGSTSCGGTSYGSVTITTGQTACTQTGVVRSIRPGTPTVSQPGSCSPGTAEITGAVEPVGPTTVCCR